MKPKNKKTHVSPIPEQKETPLTQILNLKELAEGNDNSIEMQEQCITQFVELHDLGELYLQVKEIVEHIAKKIQDKTFDNVRFLPLIRHYIYELAEQIFSDQSPDKIWLHSAAGSPLIRDLICSALLDAGRSIKARRAQNKETMLHVLLEPCLTADCGTTFGFNYLQRFSHLMVEKYGRKFAIDMWQQRVNSSSDPKIIEHALRNLTRLCYSSDPAIEIAVKFASSNKKKGPSCIVDELYELTKSKVSHEQIPLMFQKFQEILGYRLEDLATRDQCWAFKAFADYLIEIIKSEKIDLRKGTNAHAFRSTLVEIHKVFEKKYQEKEKAFIARAFEVIRALTEHARYQNEFHILQIKSKAPKDPKKRFPWE
ncbi:hypothetical protein J7E62_04965 [Variovorax paradoxus]|nr:hypothetical protein [Variovorax paradoxus]